MAKMGFLKGPVPVPVLREKGWLVASGYENGGGIDIVFGDRAVRGEEIVMIDPKVGITFFPKGKFFLLKNKKGGWTGIVNDKE